MSLQPIDMVDRYAFWEDACRTLAASIARVLMLSGTPATRRNILAFVDSLPKSRIEVTSEEWQQSFCSKCLEKAFDSHHESGPEFMYYFLLYFPTRQHHAQEMLVESMRGYVLGITVEGEFLEKGD